MLTRFRIEVEEKTVAECVEALEKYQHAIHAIEADRFHDQWPITLEAEVGLGGEEPSPIKIEAAENEYPTACSWEMPMEDRHFYMEELGAEVTEEVIQYDPTIPAYKGRRVVKLSRVDTRNEIFVAIKPYFDFQMTGLGESSTGNSAAS